jgi:hypothetical protein
MPFLAPATLAWLIPSVIGAGATLGTGIYASKAARSPSNYRPGTPGYEQMRLMGERRRASEEGRRFAGEVRPHMLNLLERVPGVSDEALSTFGDAGETFDEALRDVGTARDYYQGLLGDRAAVTNLLSPEIQQINRNYQAALQQAQEFGPRSGVSSTVAGELPFQKAAEISNLIAGVRPGAAAAMGPISEIVANIGTNQTNLGQNIGNLGINLGSMGANLGNVMSSLYGQSGQGGTDLMAAENQRRQQDLGMAGKIGEFFFNTAKGVDWGSVFGVNPYVEPPPVGSGPYDPTKPGGYPMPPGPQFPPTTLPYNPGWGSGTYTPPSPPSFPGLRRNPLLGRSTGNNRSPWGSSW